MQGIATHGHSHTQLNVTQASAWEDLRAARSLVKGQRKRTLAALNEIFRAGRPPSPALNGRYGGELIALDLAPGLTQFLGAITATWMPWLGKTFDAYRHRGDNIFSRDSLVLAHAFWPFYHRYIDDRPETFRAFPFRTYLGPGRADPDRSVLKIDYDLHLNPPLTIRRVLDELVQIGEGCYLGKAHLKWWGGKWQVVAYFTLEKNGAFV